MQKNIKLFTPVIVLLMALSVVITITTFFFDRWLFIICSVISIVFFVAAYLMLAAINQKASKALATLSESIVYGNEKAFIDSSVPTMVVYNGSEIIWYNDACLEIVLDGKSLLGEHIATLFPQLDVSSNSGTDGVNISLGEKRFTGYITLNPDDNGVTSVVYLIEDTKLKADSYEYYQTRLSVAIVLVDNYEELVQDQKDIERAQIIGTIEDAILKYFEEHSGYVIRLERDRYIVIVQERGVVKMKEDKFLLLDRVRSMDLGERLNATLSIGLGHGIDNLSKAQEQASQALDMCLGRGGDQAAIKSKEGTYEFFGGVSSGMEKRTKVKTRIIASALSELVEASNNVIIMGHKLADLDALGAAVGMLCAVRELNKRSFICINQKKNLAIQMLDRLKTEDGYSDKDLKEPEEALKLVNNGTLLIIVDAHIPGVLESQELYNRCKMVVVIDHHRKLVDHIRNAVIFYHESYASSASEMVTELIQYFPIVPQLSKVEAEALLGGITLDTKNFVMRTGVRTFEAAAWLRRMGADTVEVRRMFASTMENYRSKAAIVSQAESYRNCAIAIAPQTFDDIRIVSSQAADDLMNISETNASFVIFPDGDRINVSARSLGAINVQVIMEALGGGGHLTMAAAQFDDETLEGVKARLETAINGYYASLSEEMLEKLNVSAKPLSSGEFIEDGAMIEGQYLTEVKALSSEE